MGKRRGERTRCSGILTISTSPARNGSSAHVLFLCYLAVSRNGGDEETKRETAIADEKMDDAENRELAAAASGCPIVVE